MLRNIIITGFVVLPVMACSMDDAKIVAQTTGTVVGSVVGGQIGSLVGSQVGGLLGGAVGKMGIDVFEVSDRQLHKIARETALSQDGLYMKDWESEKTTAYGSVIVAPVHPEGINGQKGCRLLHEQYVLPQQPIIRTLSIACQKDNQLEWNIQPVNIPSIPTII